MSRANALTKDEVKSLWIKSLWEDFLVNFCCQLLFYPAYTKDMRKVTALYIIMQTIIILYVS